MSTINIGDITNAKFKVGAADCSIYLGDVKLYPQGSQPFKYKFKLSDTSVVTAECDSSSAITSAETSVYKTRLVEAEVGDCVTSLGEKAFYFMDSIFTSVTIPNSVTSIGNNAFAWDSGLISVEIPDSVTNIGNNAFDSCSSLSSITIPNSVTNIGSYAFAYCYSLTSVTIGSGVTSIGNRAFNNNSGLTSVTIETVTPPTLGSDAFNNTNNCPIYVPAQSLEAYKSASVWSSYASRIQATPTGSICFEVFSEPITSYTSTTYDSVYSTADEKWYMLNNLNQYEEYGVYDIVEDIASATTYEGKLGIVGEIEYQYSGGSWSVVGSYVDSSVTYTIDNTRPSPYVGQELSTTFKIPYGDIEAVGMVDLGIRDNNGGYLSINLDTSGLAEYRYDGSNFYQGTVTNDGEYFYLSLPSEAPQSILINSVNYWNSTPIHIIVGSKQATIEYVEKATPSYSIYSTVQEMESVGCPDVGINEYAFVGTDLYKYFTNEEWDEVSYYEPKMVAFYGEGNPMVVYKNGNTVLSQDETKIKAVSPVSVYVGDSVTSIGENAFNDNSYPYENLITAVTFSENSQLTSIGGDAFYECSSITSVTIPNSVTSIGSNAFASCSNLTSINIPSGVTNIGGFAFSNTPWWNTYSADTSHQYGNIIYINDVAYYRTSSAITSCNFREGTVGIGGGAFQSCRSLTSVAIPNSVTNIGDYAFAYCSGLTSVTIGSGVTEIGGWAFNGCRSLASINIPDNVTSIGNMAFNGCSGLTSVTIGSGVTEIGGQTFYNSTNASFTIKALTPPTITSGALPPPSSLTKTIYVPAQSVNAYKTASIWSSYASKIQPIV